MHRSRLATDDKLSWVDALRGYAILGVIAVHVSLWLRPGGELAALAAQGARGVQLFFVVSAFTLIRSHRRRADSGDHSAAAFYLRRLFRIAPMFWCALAGYCLWWGVAARGLDWRHVAASAAFVHAAHASTVNSVVPGQWSIAVEMVMYALMPALFRVLTGPRAALYFTGACMAGALLVGWPLSRVCRDVGDYFFFWPPNQAAVFGIGFLLWFACDAADRAGIRWQRVDCWAVIAGSLAAMWCLGHGSGYKLLPQHVLFSAAFAVVAFALSRRPTRLLVHAPIARLGTVSYSMYLIHFAVIAIAKRWLPPGTIGWGSFAAAFGAATAASWLAAEITYALVERPGIALGARFVRRAAARVATAPPAKHAGDEVARSATTATA